MSPAVRVSGSLTVGDDRWPVLKLPSSPGPGCSSRPTRAPSCSRAGGVRRGSVSGASGFDLCGGLGRRGRSWRLSQRGEPGGHGRLGAGQSPAHGLTWKHTGDEPAGLGFQGSILTYDLPRLDHAAAGGHHGVPDLLPSLAVLHRAAEDTAKPAFTCRRRRKTGVGFLSANPFRSPSPSPPPRPPAWIHPGAQRAARSARPL